MAAVPKPQPRDWLAAAADELRQGDRATLSLLQESYRNVNRILKGLPDAPDAAFGNLIYRAQLERTRRALLAEQAKLFDRLGDKVSARRLRSASRAARLSAASDAALLRLVGEDEAGQRLYAGADITAQRTVETILARAKLSAVPLAERIYNTRVWMNKRLDHLIVSTMAAGLNAQKFAKVARDWFAPSVPGGTRYAAMRLARTEINNAFHATSIAYAQDKPWVSQMDWNLSKSHPKPDKCNEYAAASPWDVYAIPRKPHPQCMCYVTEVSPDEDEWIDRFVAGEFDDYLDGELAKADANLGIKPNPTTAPPAVKVKPKTFGETISLPKTQVAALGRLSDNGMTRSEWQRTGANVNAIDALVRKKLVIRTSETRTEYGPNHEPYQEAVLRRVSNAPIEAAGEAAHAAVPRGLTKKGTLTVAQKNALKHYESADFIVINGPLRRGEQPSGDTMRNIDSAMDDSRLIHPIQAWRGMTNASLLFGDRLKHDLTGFSWSDLAYGSLSSEERVADDFMVLGDNPGQEVKLLVHVAQGVGALTISPNDPDNQAEILLQRATTWKVTRDHGWDPKRGFRLLEVEVTI